MDRWQANGHTLIAGTISGFMLIDEKDDHTLKAMLVTPLPFRQYVMYRLGVPTVLSGVIVFAMVLAVNQALVSLWQLFWLSVGASFTAPIVALFYAIFAANKVQGFAMAKFVGIAGWTILFGWFVEGHWQWLVGIFPLFWNSKAYWMALGGQGLWWAALIVGIVLQAGLVV